ncbi:MAG: glycosyltransferase family 4 protein [Leptolyngbyaceae cyanobacterium bins.59]|nr:glycosyltransferase family 4 protein [Leptolyngbyaceae cyanobacterium bins.59]
MVTQFYPPDYAATGQLIEELIKHLANYGMHIRVFTGQPGYAFSKSSAPILEESSNVLIRRSRTARLWPQRIRGKALNGLLFCVRSGLHLIGTVWRSDLLLLTTAPPYLPLLGYLVHLLFGVSYVCLLYDLYPDVAVELNVIPSTHWLAGLWDRLNYLVWKQAEGVIVLSPTMKDRITAKYPEIADKISVIHNWADPDWIVPIQKEDNWFAQKNNLTQKFTVLYSGNMGRCHDMETIMDAAVALKNEPIQFVFIGGGAKRQGCIERAQAENLSNCLFLPYQDRETIPYSLTACDVSLVSVGFGMEGLIAPSKFYGSLAAGRPVAVVCQPHSYLRHIVEEAQCGAAFDINDGGGLAKFIYSLYEDRQLASEMGNAGRCYLESHFTPEVIARKYFKVLSACADRTPRNEEPIEPLNSADKRTLSKSSFPSKLVRWLKS